MRFDECSGTVDEAKEVVTKARMWRWKPDGEVTYRFAQDAQGTPLPLMQVRGRVGERVGGRGDVRARRCRSCR